MTYPPLPQQIADMIARARRLEWWTLGLLWSC